MHRCLARLYYLVRIVIRIRKILTDITREHGLLDLPFPTVHFFLWSSSLKSCSSLSFGFEVEQTGRLRTGPVRISDLTLFILCCKFREDSSTWNVLWHRHFFWIFVKIKLQSVSNVKSWNEICIHFMEKVFQRYIRAPQKNVYRMLKIPKFWSDVLWTSYALLSSGRNSFAVTNVLTDFNFLLKSGTLKIDFVPQPARCEYCSLLGSVIASRMHWQVIQRSSRFDRPRHQFIKWIAMKQQNYPFSTGNKSVEAPLFVWQYHIRRINHQVLWKERDRILAKLPQIFANRCLRGGKNG
jgi:hypothetical protein